MLSVILEKNLSPFFIISDLFAIWKTLLISLESNDGIQARLFYTEKGYNELEIIPIIKKKCYFSKWDKEVMIPSKNKLIDSLNVSVAFGIILSEFR